MTPQEKLDPWSHRDEEPSRKEFKAGQRERGDPGTAEEARISLKESILQVTKLEFKVQVLTSKPQGVCYKVPDQGVKAALTLAGHVTLSHRTQNFFDKALQSGR